MEFEIVFTILTVVFIVNAIVANEFNKIAKHKGFNDSKYFVYSLLLGLVGWLMVCALPDRNKNITNDKPKVESDHLPEL